MQSGAEYAHTDAIKRGMTNSAAALFVAVEHSLNLVHADGASMAAPKHRPQGQTMWAEAGPGG